MNFDIGRFNIEIRFSSVFNWTWFSGHELVANYIERYYYWLFLCLYIREVGIERDNVESLDVRRIEKRKGQDEER